MFDIGFTELLLIGIVALIVVGPEKLPGAVRTGLKYVRQFKNSVSHIRDEVERELELDEIKSDFKTNKTQINKAIGYDDLHESLGELKQEANKLRDPELWDENKDDNKNEAAVEQAIEADLNQLPEVHGPHLPSPDAEADTGVEIIPNIPKNNRLDKKNVDK